MNMAKFQREQLNQKQTKSRETNKTLLPHGHAVFSSTPQTV